MTKNIRVTSALNQQLRDGISSQVRLIRRQLDSRDDTFPESFKQLDVEAYRKQIEYLRLDIGQQERLAVEKIRLLHSELGVEGFQVYELLRAGDYQRARAPMSSIEGLQKKIDEAFEELHDLQLVKLESTQARLNSSASAAFVPIAGLVSGVILVLALVLALLRSRVVLPMNSIHDAANRVRDGDFSARAAVHRPDEVGEVARAFNFMAESLAESYADLERKVEERTREVQKLQQEMVHAAKMSAVGQMISGVAHELNNPLTVIIGYTELNASRLAAAGGDPAQIKLLEELHFQADRCRKIVANLLQFARRADTKFETLDVNRLIEGVVQLREYEFRGCGIVIVRDYDPSNPVLSADRNKLQQILLNLIANAYDAIREAGRAGCIRVKTELVGGKVKIEIADDGIGIAEPGRVFEPFYTTKEVGKGTGLGLSVCYGIVREHGGEIEAENLHPGARFTVTLPVSRHNDEHAKGHGQVSPEAAGGSN